MANFRKILATLSTVALLSTLVVTTAVSAAGYTDVSADHWAKSYVDNLVELGVFTGEGKFRPADNMSRAEFVKSVVVAAGLQGTTAITFPDVKDGDWFAPYVKTAVANGVIGGYANGKFGPNDSLTREQAAKIVAKAFDLPAVTPTKPSFSDVKATDWSYPYVETLVSYGIVSGYGNGKFGPMDSVKREQVAKIVSLALSPATPVDGGTEVSGGDLGVMISSSTPDAVTLPCSSTADEVFAVDLKAGDKDVTFNGFTVHKKGVGALPSTMQAYLYDGADRLTAGKSLNSSTNNIEFSNVGLMVMAGKTKTVMMKIDVGTSCTAGEVNFELVDSSAVKSTADAVTGDFPITSETVGVSATNAGTITIAKNGSTTAPKVGETGVTIAKFTLNAATEAAKVSKLGLYVTGTISSTDVVNLKLYVAGQTDPLATVDGVNAKDLAQFTFDTPYEIEKGGTKSFYVTADLNPGRNGDTVAVYIDENTDLEVIGGTYGFGMAVTKTNYMSTTCTAGSSTTCSFSTLEGGDITITSGGPAAADIAVNAKDVHLMDFKIVSVSDVTFKNLDVSLTPGSLDATDDDAGLLGDDAAANYTDVKIVNVDTGETLMGPVDVTSFHTSDEGATPIGIGTDGAISYYTFTDEFSMAAGQTLNLALTADVANDASLSTDTLLAKLELAGTYPQIRDVNNKTLTNSSSLVPASAITGKTMTVASASLVTALAAVPVAGPAAHTATNNSNTYVKGQKALKFVGISAKCGTASNCKVTDLALTGYMDSDNSGVYAAGTEGGVTVSSYVGSVWVDDGDGNHVATAKSVNSTTGAVSFTSLNYTIPAGKTVILYVIGDLSSSAAALDNVSFALASGGITYEDKDGNSATSTGAVNGTTAPTTYLSTSAGGVITASVDPSTPKDSIAVAGTSDVEVTRFKFSGTREDFTVKALSISAYQLGVASTDLGEYDNNISSLKIEYTNSAGVTETKSGYLTSGTAQFSGMDLFLKKDDDATMKVYATLSTIAAGASAGEVVQLNLALNNFEALSGSGGESYKADKLDADSALVSVGSIAWTTTVGPKTIAAAANTVTIGTSETVTVPDLDVSLPVGTLVKFGAASTTWTAATEVAIVTTSTYNDGDLTLTGLVINNADGQIDTGGVENVYYSLPGTGYLTATNMMHVYETKPTLALASSSPSGSRSVSSSDEAFVFTVSADSHEKVQIRTGTALTTCAIGFDVGNDGDQTVAAASTTAAIDGSDCLLTQVASSTADDSISFDAGATSVISQYARASFWMRTSATAPQFADIQYGTDAAAGGGATGSVDNVSTLAASDCTIQGTSSSADMVASNWYFCDVAIPAATTTERYFHIITHEITELSNTKTLTIDQLVLYNDKITMDLSGDDIGTYAEMQTSAASGTVTATLKDSGSTVATGYVYKNTSAAAEGGSASITFVPISGTDAAIEIAKGTTKTYTVVLSTSALLDEDASADDPLTFSIDLGSYSGVTAGTPTGDFWWNDTNFSNATVGSATGTSYGLTTPGIVKWVGQVPSSTLTSNTVKY